jgi:flagellar biosynthesis chaperone FliJ
MGEKIEEQIEKLIFSRDALYNDLNIYGNSLSIMSRVSIQNTISTIEKHIHEYQKQLDDMKWFDFINSCMGERNGDK